MAVIDSFLDGLVRLSPLLSIGLLFLGASYGFKREMRKTEREELLRIEEKLRMELGAAKIPAVVAVGGALASGHAVHEQVAALDRLTTAMTMLAEGYSAAAAQDGDRLKAMHAAVEEFGRVNRRFNELLDMLPRVVRGTRDGATPD